MSERVRCPTVTARLQAVGGLRSLALTWCGLGLALYGCGKSHTDGVSTPPEAVVLPPVAPTLPDMSRRIGLQVTIDGVTYQATGLLIGDGAIRLSIGDGLGGLALLQLVGDVVQTNGYIAGGGTIYGEACASAPLARFCDRPSPAEFELPTADEAEGTIWVTTAGGQETWTWQTYSWSPLAALPSALPWDAVKGLYSIRGTELAGKTAGTVLTIDSQGRLFFQSSETGCTGNGTMALRPDLDADLYDVSLTIEGCIDTYAYLNNHFEGLSMMDNDSACTGCWDDGVGLLDTPTFWLSTPAGAAALSFSADPID